MGIKASMAAAKDGFLKETKRDRNEFGCKRGIDQNGFASVPLTSVLCNRGHLGPCQQSGRKNRFLNPAHNVKLDVQRTFQKRAHAPEFGVTLFQQFFTRNGQQFA